MQALKQAARDGDIAKLDALRDTYSLGLEPASGPTAEPLTPPAPPTNQAPPPRQSVSSPQEDDSSTSIELEKSPT